MLSFLTDLFKGDFSNLGSDITHAPESLAKHPSELYEAAAGTAAAGLTALTFGADLPALGAFGGAFGAGDAGASAGGAGLDALIGGSDAASSLPSDALSFADTGAGSAGQTLYGAGTMGPFDPTAAAGTPGSGFAGPVAPTVGSTPAGFAPTDAELAGAPTGQGVAPSGGGNSWSDFLGTLGTNTKNYLATPQGAFQVAGIGAGAAGLGYELFKGQQPPPYAPNLTQTANQLGQEGQVLQNYLQSGTLPPALQAQLNQATAAAKARAVSNAAANGLPTDPSQNTQLASEFAQIDTNAVASMGGVQTALLQQGLAATGISTGIYESLNQIQTEQNQQMMQAIANFAAAWGGGFKISNTQNQTKATT
jgi:hypothetical protein